MHGLHSQVSLDCASLGLSLDLGHSLALAQASALRSVPLGWATLALGLGLRGLWACSALAWAVLGLWPWLTLGSRRDGGWDLGEGNDGTSRDGMRRDELWLGLELALAFA